MNENKVLKSIREASMIVFVISTLFPGLSTKIIAIPSILIWIIANILIDKRIFFDFFIKPNFLMYSIYFWILTNIIYIITGYAPELRETIINYIRIAISAIIYLYYLKCNNVTTLKTIVFSSLMTMIIINNVTIITNLTNYNISRVLSTSLALEHNIFGIGTYSYIYALIYPVLIIIAYLLKNIKLIIDKFRLSKKIDYKVIAFIIFVLLSLYTLYVAEFLISILLILLGLVLILLKVDNIKILMKDVAILIIVLVVLSPVLNIVFKTISENTDSDNLKIRAQDLHILFSGGNIEDSLDLRLRLEVYEKSIKAFKEHPILGTSIDKECVFEIGGHSTVLDQLGKYGLICSFPFFLFVFALYKEVYKTFETDWAKRIYFMCLTVFTIFMIINTAMFIQIFYVLFTMAPMMLKILENSKLKQTDERV